MLVCKRWHNVITAQPPLHSLWHTGTLAGGELVLTHAGLQTLLRWAQRTPVRRICINQILTSRVRSVCKRHCRDMHICFVARRQQLQCMRECT